MGANTGISWTDSTWNPIRGCSLVSEGCRNCYAMHVAGRFCGPGQPYEGLVNLTSQGPKWNGTMMVVDKAMDQPIRWGRPRLIFTNSMSDLFHEGLSEDTIRQVFDVMEQANWHTFQVLTKRTQRMSELCRDMTLSSGRHIGKDPLPNVWLGTSIENNEAAIKRSPFLAATPAAVRFWSAEPLIGDIDWDTLLHNQIVNEKTCEWVIFGGESQTGCRPMELQWVRDGVASCRALGISPYVKQLGTIWAQSSGAKSRAGEDPEEWPEDLRVREYPLDIAKWMAEAEERAPGRVRKGKVK